MVPTLIKDLLASSPDGRKVTVCGWVRTVRDSKNLVFIQVNDGSCFANIQLTFDRNAPSANANVNNIEEELKKAMDTALDLHIESNEKEYSVDLENYLEEDYVDAFENIVYLDDIGLDEEESLEDSTIELYPGVRTVSLKNKK